MVHPFARTILNNGYVYVNGGSPFKPNTMDPGGSLVSSKKAYNTNVYKHKIGDSSEVIANKRRLAIGKNSNRIGVSYGEASSYSNYNTNDVKRALRKARSSGYVSPPKKNM
jgi:restriction endonuclease S subunit